MFPLVPEVTGGSREDQSAKTPRDIAQEGQDSAVRADSIDTTAAGSDDGEDANLPEETGSSTGLTAQITNLSIQDNLHVATQNSGVVSALQTVTFLDYMDSGPKLASASAVEDFDGFSPPRKVARLSPQINQSVVTSGSSYFPEWFVSDDITNSQQNTVTKYDTSVAYQFPPLRAAL